jgi:hypothetical protein
MWMKFDSLKNMCYEGHIGQSVHLKCTWDYMKSQYLMLKIL